MLKTNKNKITNNKWYKYVVIYSVTLISLVVNGYSVFLKGYSFEEFLISQTISSFENDYEINFFKQYIYLITNIMLDEPISLLTNSMPYIENNKEFEENYCEIIGYFSGGDNKVSKEDLINDKPSKSEVLDNKFDTNKLKDNSYVKDKLMFANSSMAFDVDMIEEWDFYKLSQMPIRLNNSIEGPKVLIFHTHAREEFKGGITVLDVADALKKELEEKYGIEVMHVREDFYEQSNVGNRPTGGEYERMEPVIQDIIDANPSIDLVIDMHRDGVGEKIHLVTDINGKKTAKVMFVTPLCRHRNINGDVVYKTDLPNPYLETNLAFALQMYIKANEYYPNFCRKIYVSEWRMSTHMKAQSLLLEWGAETNTAEEALNAVEPVANTIYRVLESN